MTASHNRVRMAAGVSMKLVDFHVIVKRRDTRVYFVKRTLTNALKIRVKIMAFVSIIMAHILVSVLLASEAKIAIRFSMNATIKKKVSSYMKDFSLWVS